MPKVLYVENAAMALRVTYSSFEPKEAHQIDFLHSLQIPLMGQGILDSRHSVFESHGR